MVDARKRVLGEGHPETLAATLELSVSYSQQGHYQQAEYLYFHVVNALERTLSKEDPNMLTAIPHLAITYTSAQNFCTT